MASHGFVDGMIKSLKHNARPRQNTFEKIKLYLDSEEVEGKKLTFKTATEAEKKVLREKIRQKLKRDRKVRIWTILVTLVATPIVFYFLLYGIYGWFF
jgi:hypothetical protein